MRNSQSNGQGLPKRSCLFLGRLEHQKSFYKKRVAQQPPLALIMYNDKK